MIHVLFNMEMQLTHLNQKGLFVFLVTSKRESKAFPLPSPPCNVVPLFKLGIENTPTLNGREGGGGSLDSRSLKSPYL